MNLGKQLSAEIMIVVIVTLLLGAMGPFGTYAMPTGLRLAYWVGFGLIGYLIFRPISFVADWLSEISPVPIWLSIIMATMVATFPMTLLIGFAIGGFQADGNPMLQDHFGQLYLQCAGIGIGIFLLMRLLFGPATERMKNLPEAGQEKIPGTETPETETPATKSLDHPRLMERLPASFAAPVIALGTEDHYVRVFGRDGTSEMLLMRLGDAIAEMDGVEGLQVHRSWWVAAEAVMRGEREDRKTILHLKGGMKIPVARNRVAAARTAGLIS